MTDIKSLFFCLKSFKIQNVQVLVSQLITVSTQTQVHYLDKNGPDSYRPGDHETLPSRPPHSLQKSTSRIIESLKLSLYLTSFYKFDQSLRLGHFM